MVLDGDTMLTASEWMTDEFQEMAWKPTLLFSWEWSLHFRSASSRYYYWSTCRVGNFGNFMVAEKVYPDLVRGDDNARKGEGSATD